MTGTTTRRAGYENCNPEDIGLGALIREDLATHEGDWTTPGFRALVVHRLGNWRMGVSSFALRAPLSMLYRMASRRIIRSYGIELPYSAIVGRRVRIDHHSGIVINGYSVIGDECVLRQNTTLGIPSTDQPDAAPVLGRGVDVGVGVVILGRIHVGDGAVIGANAVVVRDVPAGATAVGIPARVLERRPPD